MHSFNVYKKSLLLEFCKVSHFRSITMESYLISDRCIIFYWSIFDQRKQSEAVQMDRCCSVRSISVLCQIFWDVCEAFVLVGRWSTCAIQLTDTDQVILVGNDPVPICFMPVTVYPTSSELVRSGCEMGCSSLDCNNGGHCSVAWRAGEKVSCDCSRTSYAGPHCTVGRLSDLVEAFRCRCW